MARYRLRSAAYFDNAIHVYHVLDAKGNRVEWNREIESVHLSEGTEFEFRGIPAEHMEPLDAEARKATELANKDRAKWDEISMQAQRMAMQPQIPMAANLLPPSGR